MIRARSKFLCFSWYRSLISECIAENQWLHLRFIKDLKKACYEVFPIAEYAYTTVPTYPSSQIGFMVCSKDATKDVKKLLMSILDDEEERMFRYSYSAKVFVIIIRKSTRLVSFCPFLLQPR